MGRRPLSKPSADDLGLGIGVIGPKPLHQWEDTGRTARDAVGMKYQIYKCTCCGMTGKRYGISQWMCFPGPCL